MILLGRDLITNFTIRHPDAVRALRSWRELIESGTYRHIVDLKRSFGSVDYVRPFFVFDVRGGNFRLIARISFQGRTVSIHRVLTHPEYDEGKWRKP